uniref:Uncharacterized protein n=1 Tax=Anguilla anguilla TaxID=7936 RepID=A0A0E9UCJ8_ANGAN
MSFCKGIVQYAVVREQCAVGNAVSF